MHPPMHYLKRDQATTPRRSLGPLSFVELLFWDTTQHVRFVEHNSPFGELRLIPRGWEVVSSAWFLLPTRMRSRQRWWGLVASYEEAISYLRRPTREGADGSRSSRESDDGSPGSPSSSPSANTARYRAATVEIYRHWPISCGNREETTLTRWYHSKLKSLILNTSKQLKPNNFDNLRTYSCIILLHNLS